MTAVFFWVLRAFANHHCARPFPASKIRHCSYQSRKIHHVVLCIYFLIISWQDGAESPLEMMVTTLCDVMQHYLSRSEWDEAGQERSRHCLPQTSSTTQPFSPVCPSAVSPLAFFCIFLHFLHLYINSLQHFLFSALLLTGNITASLFITQIANKLCALCEEQATEDVRFREWGGCARFWAITYKAVKTQPVHAKGQLSVN